MPSLLQSFLLLALITLVLAAPAPGNPHPIQKRSFKVERVPNPNFRRAVNHVRAPGAGTRALIKAYRKYSQPLPAGLLEAMGQAAAAGASPVDAIVDEILGQKAAGTKTKTKKPKATSTATPKAAAGNASSAATNTTGSGVVVTTPEQGDVEYLSPIQIGGQTINMDFDSGSSDLWVFNTQLPARTQAGHTVFDPSKSTSFQVMTGASYSISYGDGSGSAGTVGTDTVAIGGVSVTSQAVELPTAVSGSFVTDVNSQGLVGLAFSKLNTVKPQAQKTFFDNALPQLNAPVFTADLRANAPGTYEFGNIDATKFNGSLTWAAVNTTQGFWQFSSNKITVGTGAAMTLPPAQAIADTGTTLMLVNAATVNAYYSQVTGAVNNDTVGGVTFPCSNVMPDLTVDVGGVYDAVVRGEDINFAPVDATGTTCFGGVQAIAGDLQIYGDIFFKSQFVAFNAGNNTLGMAPHQ